MKKLYTIILLLFFYSSFAQLKILNTPPVSNQGSEGSCAAFSIGYYLRSIEEYYTKGYSNYDYSTNIFSPEFLYNQTKAGSDCLSGSSVVNNLNFIKNNGICTWNSMPYSDQNGCNVLPNTVQLNEAVKYKLGNYDTVLSSNVVRIKSLINNNHPIVFSFTPDNLFTNADSSFIWKELGTTFYGPHTCVIVGYDDNKNAYRIVNQRGNAWGDKGYSWIDYNFFKVITYDCYYISSLLINNPPKVNAGNDTTYLTATNLASITLSGKISDDNVGFTSSWKDISDNTVYPSSTSSQNNLLVQKPTGVFKFSLTATDANNLTTSDTVQVTVRDTNTYNIPSTTSTSLTGGKIGKSGVSLSWSTTLQKDTLVSSTLYVSINGGNWQPVTSTTSLNGSYTNNNLSGGTNYSYRVVSISRNSQATSNTISIKTGGKAQRIPIIQTPNIIGNKTTQ